ncbi:hypothetical protein HanIR_Chr15g0760371 [Helianthus annuus]|nr:hypothetical protein HanIR_Chr15g0760371 [Helianthus annuus]
MSIIISYQSRDSHSRSTIVKCMCALKSYCHDITFVNRGDI